MNSTVFRLFASPCYAMSLTICLIMPASAALTDVKVDFRKVGGTDDIYIMDVKPIGSLEPRIDEPDSVCAASPGWTCDTYYTVYTNELTDCQPRVLTVQPGTTLKSLMARINSTWINKTCSSAPYKSDGREAPCAEIASYSGWYSKVNDRYHNLVYKLAGCGGGGIRPPVEPVYCSLQGGDIVLNHGSLDHNKINHNVTASQVRVTCTRTATFELSLLNNGRVNMGNSNHFYSTLSLDGKGAKVTIANKDSASVELKSTLTDEVGVAGGEYAGSTTLTLNVL